MKDSVKIPFWLIPCGVIIHCIIILLGLSADPDNLRKLLISWEADESPLCKINNTPVSRAVVFVHQPLRPPQKWKTINSFISGVNRCKRPSSILDQCLQNMITVSAGTFYFNSSNFVHDDQEGNSVQSVVLYRYPSDANNEERQVLFITDVSENNDTRHLYTKDNVSKAFLEYFPDDKTIFVELKKSESRLKMTMWKSEQSDKRDENKLKLSLWQNVNKKEIFDITYSNTTDPCEKLLYLFGVSSPKSLSFPVISHSFGVSDDYEVAMAGCIAHKYSWLAYRVHNFFPSLFENTYYASSQSVPNATNYWLNPTEKQKNNNLTEYIAAVSEKSIQIDSKSWEITCYLCILAIITSWIFVLIKYNMQQPQRTIETEDDDVSSSCYKVARTICNIMFAKLGVISVFFILMRIWPTFFAIALLMNTLWWHIFYCSEMYYYFFKSMTISGLQFYSYRLLYYIIVCCVQVISIILGAAYNLLFSHLIEFKLIGRADMRYKMLWLFSTVFMWLTLITPEGITTSMLALQVSMMLSLVLIAMFLWFSYDSVNTCILSLVILASALTSIALLNLVHFSHAVAGSSSPALIYTTRVVFFICTFLPTLLSDDLLLRRLGLICCCVTFPFTMVSLGNESLVFAAAIGRLVIWLSSVLRTKNLEISHEMTAVFFLNTTSIYWITLGNQTVTVLPYEFSLSLAGFTLLKMLFYSFLLNCIFFTMIRLKSGCVKLLFHSVLLQSNLLSLLLFSVVLTLNINIYDFLSHQLISVCTLAMFLPAAAMTKGTTMASRIEVNTIKAPELRLHL